MTTATRPREKGVRAFYDLLARPMLLQFMYLIVMVLGAPLVFIPGDASPMEIWNTAVVSEPLTFAIWRGTLIIPAVFAWLYISVAGQVMGMPFAWCLPGLRKGMFNASLHLMVMACATAWYVNAHFHRPVFLAVGLCAFTFAAIFSLGSGPAFLRWYWLLWIVALVRPSAVLPTLMSHATFVALSASGAAVWLMQRQRTSATQRARTEWTIDFSTNREGWFSRLIFGSERRTTVYAKVKNTTFDWYRALLNSRTPRLLGPLSASVVPSVLFGLMCYLLGDYFMLVLVVGFGAGPDTFGLQGSIPYPVSRDRRAVLALLDHVIAMIALAFSLIVVLYLFNVIRPLAAFLDITPGPMRGELGSTLAVLLMWLTFSHIAPSIPPIRDLTTNPSRDGLRHTIMGYAITLAMAGAAFKSLMMYRQFSKSMEASTLFTIAVALLVLANVIYYLVIRRSYHTRDLA